MITTLIMLSNRNSNISMNIKNYYADYADETMIPYLMCYVDDNLV